MANRSTIGVLTPLVGGFYFTGLLAGLQEVTRQRGMRLLVVCTSPDQQQLPEELLASSQVDAWMVVLSPLSSKHQRALAHKNVPRVSVSAVLPDLACPSVLPNNRVGTAAAVGHLIDHGHRRIAFVGSLQQLDIRQRYQGYQDALAERGLPFDQQLVFGCPDNLEPSGADAARQLLASGVDCSAVVSGTDQNAIGFLEAVQAAGLRVPEDMAITGFDDMSLAQKARPPLTTVRQSFDALGRAAGELLLAQLAGEHVPAETIYVETMLVVRNSCGCSGIRSINSTRALLQPADDWQAHLTRELVELATYPVTVPPNAPPAAIWPGSAGLVAALARVLRSESEPAWSQQQAWQEAVALSKEPEVLHDLVDLLHQAGSQQLPPGEQGAAQERLAAFIKQARIELTRARIDVEMQQSHDLQELVTINQQISMLLVESSNESTRSLDWLKQTSSVWGCLGMWEVAATGSRELKLVAAYGEGSRPALGRTYPQAQFPPLDLLPPSVEDGGLNVVTLLAVRTANREWGVLALAGPLESRYSSRPQTVLTWVDLLGAVLEREALLRSLAEQRETLQLAYENERALAETVRELGCPIIPLQPGVLLVPLVGAIDEQRAGQIVEDLLGGIGTHRAAQVLLDISAVPVVDTRVAASLIQAARAAALIGARVTLVGIRPEIAQSIVSLGIDLQLFSTFPNLSTALASLHRNR